MAPFTKRTEEEIKGRSSSLLEEFYVKNTSPPIEKKERLNLLLKDKQKSRVKSAEKSTNSKKDKEEVINSKLFNSITPNPFGEEEKGILGNF